MSTKYLSYHILSLWVLLWCYPGTQCTRSNWFACPAVSKASVLFLCMEHSLRVNFYFIYSTSVTFWICKDKGENDALPSLILSVCVYDSKHKALKLSYVLFNHSCLFLGFEYICMHLSSSLLSRLANGWSNLYWGHERCGFIYFSFEYSVFKNEKLSFLLPTHSKNECHKRQIHL